MTLLHKQIWLDGWIDGFMAKYIRLYLRKSILKVRLRRNISQIDSLVYEVMFMNYKSIEQANNAVLC